MANPNCCWCARINLDERVTTTVNGALESHIAFHRFSHAIRTHGVDDGQDIFRWPLTLCIGHRILIAHVFGIFATISDLRMPYME